MLDLAIHNKVGPVDIALLPDGIKARILQLESSRLILEQVH